MCINICIYKPDMTFYLKMSQNLNRMKRHIKVIKNKKI